MNPQAVPTSVFDASTSLLQDICTENRKPWPFHIRFPNQCTYLQKNCIILNSQKGSFVCQMWNTIHCINGPQYFDHLKTWAQRSLFVVTCCLQLYLPCSAAYPFQFLSSYSPSLICLSRIRQYLNFPQLYSIYSNFRFRFTTVQWEHMLKPNLTNQTIEYACKHSTRLERVCTPCQFPQLFLYPVLNKKHDHWLFQLHNHRRFRTCTNLLLHSYGFSIFAGSPNQTSWDFRPRCISLHSNRLHTEALSLTLQLAH